MTDYNVGPIWSHCYTCRDYAQKRREVIAGPLADKAQRENRDVVEVVDEFMLAAHSRHMNTREPLYTGGPTGIFNPAIRKLAALVNAAGITREDVHGT